MTIIAGTLSSRVAPVLLAVCTLLAAWNWYLRPERAAAWAVCLAMVAVMAVAVWLTRRRWKNDVVRRDAAESIGTAVAFACLIFIGTLGLRLADTLGGLAPDADLTRRVTMVLVGAFVVFTGNALPKRLMPLSALQCDPARVQAFQRFSGWTWVLVGLMVALVWVLLPIPLAQPLSVAIIAAGILLIASQVVRLRRGRQREA